VLSGYPHLEESIRFAELVFPLLPGKKAVTLRDQVLTGGAFDVRAGAGEGSGRPKAQA
jgi:alkanesulfonate monooxygenase